MSDIIEIITNAINGIANKRESIRSAIIAKGVSVPSGTKLSGLPSYIEQISTGGGSSTVYYHSDNPELADTYYATGSGGPQGTYGTYIKMPNAYHKGFNVYKHETNDYYLISTDDNGTTWEVAGEPSNGRQTRVSYWQELHSPDTLGPEGSYYYGAWNTNGDTCSFEISATNPSPSPSGVAPDTVYVYGTSADSNGYYGTYTKQSGTINNNAKYYCSTTGKYLFVVYNSMMSIYWWVLGSSTSASGYGSDYTFYSSNSYSSSNLPVSPVGLSYTHNNDGAQTASQFTISLTPEPDEAVNAPATVYVSGTSATSKGLEGTYTKQNQVVNRNAVYHCSSTNKYLYVVKSTAMGVSYGWVFASSPTATTSSTIYSAYDPYNTASTLAALSDTPAGITYSKPNGGGDYSTSAFQVTTTAPSSSSSSNGSGGSSYNVWGGVSMTQGFGGTYTLYSAQGGYNGTPVYRYVNGEQETYYMNKLVDDESNQFWAIYEGSYGVRTFTSGPASGNSYVYSNSNTPPTSGWNNDIIVELSPDH
jgi:hypothetical protein